MFPDPRLAGRDGFLAALPLTVEALKEAYSIGVFPWHDEGGIGAWFFPFKRGVLDFKDLHVSKSLAKLIRQGRLRVTFDQAFERVMRACAKAARPGERGTWISERFIRCYAELHREGFAHSAEAWDGERLAGGIYGVMMRGAFSAESMFYEVPNAGKVALVALVERLRARGLTWMDTQMVTPITAAFGAKEISREQYLKRLKAAHLSRAEF